MGIPFHIDATGIFKEEIKNRFRSYVIIEGHNELCYVQSSSRLDNYVKLKNKIVVLKKTSSSSKMKFSILAKPFHKDYILLCPMIANQIIYSELHRKIFSLLGLRNNALLEKEIDGYKSDIYLPSSDDIIEIKALISDDKNGNIFPTVYSERTYEQLTYFKSRLEIGKNCSFILVSFNPYFDKIILNKETKFYVLFKECINLGMKVIAVSLTCKNSVISVKRKINIKI